jgi:hypothetical protein
VVSEPGGYPGSDSRGDRMPISKKLRRRAIESSTPQRVEPQFVIQPKSPAQRKGADAKLPRGMRGRRKMEREATFKSKRRKK